MRTIYSASRAASSEARLNHHAAADQSNTAQNLDAPVNNVVIPGPQNTQLKGHGGALSAVAFNFPDSTHVARSGVKQLITVSQHSDTERIFDLTMSGGDSSHPCRVLSGHAFLPSVVNVTDDGSMLVSDGRDRMVMVWNLYAEDPSERKQTKENKEQDSIPLLSLTIPVASKHLGC